MSWAHSYHAAQTAERSPDDWDKNCDAVFRFCLDSRLNAMLCRLAGYWANRWQPRKPNSWSCSQRSLDKLRRMSGSHFHTPKAAKGLSQLDCGAFSGRRLRKRDLLCFLCVQNEFLICQELEYWKQKNKFICYHLILWARSRLCKVLWSNIQCQIFIQPASWRQFREFDFAQLILGLKA